MTPPDITQTDSLHTKPSKQLISAAALSDMIEHSTHPAPCILDCRFNMADSEQGQREYTQGHIPGAHYAHLNTTLSAPHEPGKTGRHPLPSKAAFTQALNDWGVQPDVPVICYDDSGGYYAARAWWLLHWAGLKHVMLLDGGFSAWQAAHLPLNQGAAEQASQARPQFAPVFQDDLYCTADDIVAHLSSPQATKHTLLIDARAQERYRGENEPQDPIAGHIPGATCIPFANNLNAEGYFKSATLLRERFESHATPEAIVYCGSGVTACHNIMACAIAGLPWPKLYPGSWSEWITHAERPIAIGQD